MLSGSQGDSTSVTKYPYVSPLPEAPSRLECYWYVDVSSRTETIGTLPSRALCLQRTLLIHFPFLSPFFFPAVYVYVCPADYRKRRIRAAVFLLIPSGDSGQVTRVTLEYPRFPRVSVLFSFPRRLLIFSLATTREHPPDAKSYTRGRKGSPTPDSDSRKFASSDVRSHRRTRSPSFFSLFEPLSPFFTCLRITGLISILLSSFARSGPRLSGENELFPYVPKWINCQKAIKKLYTYVLSDLYIFLTTFQNDYCRVISTSWYFEADNERYIEILRE